MKNSTLYVLLFLLITNSLFAQRLTVNNNGWLPINSKTLGVAVDIYDLRIDIDGTTVDKYPNWSIVGNVRSDIYNKCESNSDKNCNKRFPEEKIKFKFNNLRGEGWYNGSNVPQAEQLNVNQSEIIISKLKQYFVKSSPYSLKPSQYGSLILRYNIIIEGGSYLNSLISDKNYDAIFEFSIVDKNNQPISTFAHELHIKVEQDVYADLPSVSISFVNGADSVELNVLNSADYINGVNKTYEDALVVNANTGYEIGVKSLSDKFTGSGSNLDVNAVTVQLKDTKQLYNKIPLSVTNQNVATGLKLAEPKKYSIIYSTDPSKIKIGEAKPGSYKTQLPYTISPL